MSGYITLVCIESLFSLSLSLSLSRALFLFIVVVKVVVAMSERDEKRERDENAGKIEDEIEALKAIYGDEMVREEEDEDEDEDEGVAMKSSGGREGKDERTKRRLLRVVFSPSARAILSHGLCLLSVSKTVRD